MSLLKVPEVRIQWLTNNKEIKLGFSPNKTEALQGAMHPLSPHPPSLLSLNFKEY
ncbi:hypothetical protein EV14_1220 [Prochlorococcus sp. MIT 0703]|nr:hypothetical protein EV14_1220 [Prochlorococcus sp. MIT 0703]